MYKMLENKLKRTPLYLLINVYNIIKTTVTTKHFYNLHRYYRDIISKFSTDTISVSKIDDL